MSTSVPLPGQHLSDTGGGADPAGVHRRVDVLLAQLDDASGGSTQPGNAEDIARQAQILERAHDVLVESLAAVDKV
ncbi:hypothetical protein [Prescottella defluvii]|uniref:hypothetical protein n=1 Tax=Prescottella defluvii TaxID=1323361 RepID=UPI0009DF1178|nr:hypothetical protein [Prescottella defluvii]